MPLIKPFGVDKTPEILNEPPQDAIEAILENTGIKGPLKENDKAAIRKIFDNAGAGIEAIANTVAYTMKNGDSDGACLKAAEIAMKVQGVIDEVSDDRIPEITINIHGSDNKTLINLVLPKN